MTDKFRGYHLVQKFLKNKRDNKYDRVYLLYDESKLVGIFEEEMFANRYWLKYVGSGRTQVKESDEYDV